MDRVGPRRGAALPRGSSSSNRGAARPHSVPAARCDADNGHRVERFRCTRRAAARPRRRRVCWSTATPERSSAMARASAAFFRSVTDWHRWLGRSGDGRAAGRAVTGAANLAFLCLVLSGAYIWLPRMWTWRVLRGLMWFRSSASAKAREFNWHHVFGFWAAIPLVVVRRLRCGDVLPVGQRARVSRCGRGAASGSRRTDRA